MNPKAGRRFGPYEIQSRLGGGGMGFVFRAWDARLHREVAIKLLNQEYAMPGMRERFLREARAASALNHPNICTIFDIGEQDGDPYLVMELLHGETLKDRILNRTMQLDEMIVIARDTAEALGAAHAKGIVHRDVKPANIFLVDKPNGGVQAKVLDFGLAKIEGGPMGARGRSLDLTTLGATVGTLAYMSPEQARGESLDSRSDLFSLGVVMYEMATRHVPFQGATSALVFVQLLNHAPESVREWNEAVPRDLEKIIFKLLAKERTARYQTARELELALIAAAEKGSGGWLRKAVSNVPLVRAQDPVAREKRAQREKISSDHGSPSISARLSQAVKQQSGPEEMKKPRQSGDLLLRPITRLPHSGAHEPGLKGMKPEASAPTTPNASDASRDLAPLRPRAQDLSVHPAVPQHSSLPIGSRLETQATPEAGGTKNEPALIAPAATTELQNWTQDGSSSSQERPVPALLTRDMSRNHEAAVDFPPLLAPNEPARPWQLPFRPMWLGLLGIGVIVTACLAFVIANYSHLSGAHLKTADVIVVTEIENRTGERSFDDYLTEALRIELAQSRYFSIRSGASYRAARRLIAQAGPSAASASNPILARKAAERLGARAYIYGSLTGNSAAYTIHVDLRSIDSNEVLASSENRFSSIQELPHAVDRVSRELRIAAGETREAVDATSTPLAADASSDPRALQLYAEAQAFVSSHQPVAAVSDLQQAVALDPKFVRAHLLLANLYYQLRAESAAADAAKLAVASASLCDERTRILTQTTFEMEATGNYAKATTLLRHLALLYPYDPEVLVQLASSLRQQGHMAEALQVAQQAYSEDAFNAAAYAQAQSALIGLDRYDAAAQLDLQAQRLGLARRGDALAAADLDGRADLADSLVADLPVGEIEYRPDWTFGIYLDNAGRLAAGAALWRSRAEAASKNDAFRSASSYLLAQAALDRALLGDCASASGFLRSNSEFESEAGRTAIFDAGMANAFCGDATAATRAIDRLRSAYPQSFEVNGFFLADLQGAIDLRAGKPADALSVLSPRGPST